MTMVTRSIHLALAAALAALALPAFAQMAPWEQALYDAAKKEGQFTVYTAHYDTETIADICAAFDRRYPGVKCNFVRTTAQVAFQRLQQDLKANLAVASVFSSTDISHYPELKKSGLLMTYQPHNLANMVDSLKQYNDKDNQYWVTAAALIVVAYNTSLVTEKDAPKRWTDLLEPKWKDKIAIGHPAFSGYVGTWTVEMRKLYGWQFFE
ncbi:MAG: extracellular solute-binding protein, partial [Rhizobacter sp.]|nr:extracellular solute-binding protein [Rhizobacter sp.]